MVHWAADLKWQIDLMLLKINEHFMGKCITILFRSCKQNSICKLQGKTMTIIEHSIILLNDTHLSFYKICVGIIKDAAASHI